MPVSSRIKLLYIGLCILLFMSHSATGADKQIAYIAAKSDAPFWKIIGKGVKSVTSASGYGYVEMDSGQNVQKQLKNAQDAIAKNVAGIVLASIDSKSANDVLALTSKAKIPVVLVDVGSNGTEFVSYVRSDNYSGAYSLGVIMAQALKTKGWNDASFAMIALPLSQKNGQDRTNGLRDALKDNSITKEANLHQIQTYGNDETTRSMREIFAVTPPVRGLFIETDQPVSAAAAAVIAAKKSNDLLVVAFDTTADIVQLIKGQTLLAAGMEQAYLLGSKSADALVASLDGNSPAKQIYVPVLVGTGKNIDQLIPVINKMVLGNE